MRFLTISLSMMLLTACGFHPVYGVNKYTAIGAETKFSQIVIQNIPDRDGQFLRNELIDSLHRDNPSAEKKYTLTITPIQETVRRLDVTIDADTTRAQLRLKTKMQLTDRKTRETLIERDLESIASFNVLGSEFGNRISEQATRENVLNDIARQIELQLSLYFKRPPKS